MKSSNEIGPELLKLLGVDPNECIKAIIEIEAYQPVVITVQYHANPSSPPTNEDGTLNIETITKRFELVERPGS